MIAWLKSRPIKRLHPLVMCGKADLGAQTRAYKNRKNGKAVSLLIINHSADLNNSAITRFSTLLGDNTSSLAHCPNTRYDDTSSAHCVNHETIKTRLSLQELTIMV